MPAMIRLSAYDLIILQDYFAKKTNPSEEDKVRAADLDTHICLMADNVVHHKMSPEEIFEKLTG